MKRNEITTVDKLVPGDRFYKLKSRSREAFELLGPEQYGKFEVCKSGKIVNGFIGRNSVEIFKGSTVVVFLRNANEKLL